MHIGVRDLKRSVEFYRQLGLQVHLIPEANMASVSLGNVSLDLDALKPEEAGKYDETKRDMVVVAFSVPNLLGYFEKIRQQGIKTIDIPTKRPWGAYNFYLLDLDGYKIEVEQRRVE